jgi:hypothetical protein
VGIIGLAAALASAEVEMNTGVCVNAGEDLGLKYVNKTPDAWDMRGWGMSIGTGTMKGQFAAGAGGSFFVAPGATAAVNYAGCGALKGVPYNKQLEAKTGSCNEPTPPQEPLAMKCAEVNTGAANFYNPNQCIKDGLGINRGDGYGGFIDSYRDQTQIQVAIPTGTFTMGTQAVRFDPAASMGGPFYMMSLVALQEYLYTDMQFLMAMGASTSGAGLVDASGATLYKSPDNTGLDDAAYGSFTVTYKTAVGRLAVDYPKYFQTPLKLEKLVSTGGAGPTLANSPQQINSALLAAMDLWWLFDGLKAAQDLCFKQFLVDAKDKAAGLKLMLGGYHIGPNMVDNGTGADDYATHVLPTTRADILSAADVTPFMKGFAWDNGPPPGPEHNTRNYITRVFSVVDQLVNANPQSKACGGSLNIYDADISLQQVQELFFGQGGTAAAQGNGGLLWHFQIAAAERQALWNDLICVYNQLKGKAPSTAGKDAISYRYDFLTVLRVARQYFSGYVNKFTDRPTPADTYSSEYSIWVYNHSQHPCTRSTQDVTWPVMTLTDSTYRKGDLLKGSFTDNSGLKEKAYTIDPQWRQWVPVPTTADFYIPTTLTDTDKLWYRITDSCGNSTIQQIFVRNAPKLPKPVADPKATTFYDPLNVNLSDSLAAATILYTTDGTDPARTPGGSTKAYVKGTPVVISSAAPGTVTLKAIAVHPDYAASDVMIEIYTKVDKPVTAAPKATPPGQEFSSLSAGLNVTLASATPGAVIFYTIDGTAPDTAEGGSTKKYTAAIPITATTTLKAIALKDGYLKSSVMTETYTKVVPPAVATPAATPPGRNFITPLSVTLATATAGADIFYTTDGTDPASSETGATKKYAGAIAISATTTLKAIGIKSDLLPSAIMTEKYVFTPPVAVKQAYYQDRNGDGMIETVVLGFEKDLPATPDKLGFAITDVWGKSEERTAAKGEIAFAPGSKSTVVVTLAKPFAFGITSVANRDASGKMFAQDNIPLLDATFPVDDSVPPVIIKATVQEPDSANPQKRIFVTLSEGVEIPYSSQTALVWKHEGAEQSSDKVKVALIEKSGDRSYTVHIDTASAVYPIKGDSVALANDGSLKDGPGNAPVRKTFKDLDGQTPKSKPTDIYVTFPNGTKDKASDGPEPQGDVVFIPMDKGGVALPGSPADGKCVGSCFTGDAGRFVGPVFHIVTPGPVTYEFSIFTNAGELVSKGRGHLSAQDLALMDHKNDATGLKYVARVVWTGHAEGGRKAGTGAYILQATLTTDKDDRTGAPPAASRKRVVFGLLRGFKGS